MIYFLLSLILLSPANGGYQIDNAPFLTLATPDQTVMAAAPAKIDNRNIGVKLNADKFIAVDVASGRVLLEKNANVAQPLASITKLMTALVILDQKPDWNRSVVMKEIDETMGAKPHLYRGEEMTFMDLWKAGLISSDNNAIMAMVRYSGLTGNEFVLAMNAKASELGLINSHFDDPTGLSPFNVSTATDVAKILAAALSRTEISETVIQEQYQFTVKNNNKNRNLTNTDILISSFLNDEKYGYRLIGGKTGTLPEAGYCLAVEVAKHDQNVIFVILGSTSIEQRFIDAKSLVDWVFSNYNW